MIPHASKLLAAVALLVATTASAGELTIYAARDLERHALERSEGAEALRDAADFQVRPVHAGAARYFFFGSVFAS